MSNSRQPLEGIELKISSEAEKICLVGEAIYALTIYATGDEKTAMETQLAVVEALNNVVIHAYSGQPGNIIIVRWCQAKQRLQIDILDSGLFMQGLPELKLPDLEAENGRGWWIIQNCMDECFYRKFDLNSQTLETNSHQIPQGMPEPLFYNTLTLIKNFKTE